MSTIVAIDSSGKTAGVCVLRQGEVVYEDTQCTGLTHSHTLLPLVEKALDACTLAPKDVDLYAVTAGPGSFTGLRIGMALVKGLAFVYNTPVAPVSTLRALAQAHASFEGIVVPALDARRSEVYWAAFDCGGKCTRLQKDTASEVPDLSETAEFQHRPIFFVGSGAELCYNINRYRLSGQEISYTPPGTLLPIARGAAFACLQNGKRMPAPEAVPRYLRLSQAERERAARMAQHESTP